MDYVFGFGFFGYIVSFFTLVGTLFIVLYSIFWMVGKGLSSVYGRRQDFALSASLGAMVLLIFIFISGACLYILPGLELGVIHFILLVVEVALLMLMYATFYGSRKIWVRG